MRLFQLSLMAMLSTTPAWAHANYTGYSGAPGRQTCAASCHGSGTGTVTISGFPTSYTPGQAYSLTIGHTAGSSIANFNASCRVGIGTTNAGTLATGTATATYNVNGETNGVHFSGTNQNSGTFTWTVPSAGTGTVRLYAGAHQGTMGSTNNTIVMVSDEVAGAPGQATNPVPADQALDILLTDVLSWMAGSGASSHDVFLGTTNPPDSVANVTHTSYTPFQLFSGRTYYWRINERNAVGVTIGPIWQFTTLDVPGVATNPSPPDGATDVPVQVTLSWLAGARTTTHNVALGLVNPPPLIQTGLTDPTYTPPADLLPDTTYYWVIGEQNSSGVTSGPTWSFHTAAANTSGNPMGFLPTELTLGPLYPNPFNATVSIPFALPRASRVTVALYDITGRQVAMLANRNYAAGIHSLQWSSEGLGSGIYFIRLTAGNKSLSTKVVALK